VNSSVRIGALCWNQYTDWPSFMESSRRAGRLGYDTLWTWDQLPSSTGTERGDRKGHSSTVGTCWDHRTLTD
jgi:hypothetical protein